MTTFQLNIHSSFLRAKNTLGAGIIQVPLSPWTATPCGTWGKGGLTFENSPTWVCSEDGKHGCRHPKWAGTHHQGTYNQGSSRQMPSCICHMSHLVRPTSKKPPHATEESWPSFLLITWYQTCDATKESWKHVVVAAYHFFYQEGIRQPGEEKPTRLNGLKEQMY